MSEKPLLSFIIPVYNVEQYLNECLDSIFDPSVSEDEYEVIAIDDGSTDGSPAILKTYGHHKNFRVITQENAGQGPARNAGIKAANGKYISFVDSDDYLLPGAVPTLLGWARESDCDIIEFEIESHNETSLDLYEVKPRTNRISTRGTGKKLFAEWQRRGIFLPSACIRIYRRAFLNAKSLFFLPIKYEDAEWQPRCFFHAEKIIYYPITLYHYRRRPGSTITGTAETRRIDQYYIRRRLICSVRDFIESIERNSANDDFIAVLGKNMAAILKDEVCFALKHIRSNGKTIAVSELEIVDFCHEANMFIPQMSGFIESMAYRAANDDSITEFGNMLAETLEHEINLVYKYMRKSERVPLIFELKKVRRVLRYSTSTKGIHMYKLTRWLPAGMAIRMYKIL